MDLRLQDAVKRENARMRNIMEGVARDVRTIAERQLRADEIARRLSEEQKAMRVLLAGRAESNGRKDGGRLAGDPIPLALDSEAPRERPAGQTLAMASLDVCPVCGGAERTLVSEYNKTLVVDIEIDESLRRYDYSMCHACGVTYATLRPTGDTYKYLFSRFDENLGRYMFSPGKRNLLLSPTPLSDAERAELTARIARGSLVSEHLELPRQDWVPQLQSDRLANSAHIELLGSLVPLDGSRVLEIRPRFGSILASLRRLYGIETFALPMTDAQRFVLKETYGIEAAGLIDFEHFTIPYDTTFDLIVSNHMFTHALEPSEYLAEVRRHLAPGGHLYLHNEPDDAEFLSGPMSMINTLNPFHMQVFDRRSLTRALAAGGFEPVYVGHHNGKLVFLARMTGACQQPSMDRRERDHRLAAYQKARDAAVLRLPERERWRFHDEWEQIVARAVAAGAADFDEGARLRIARQTAPADEDAAHH
jgi:SAM-dependent methyltransferase